MWIIPQLVRAGGGRASPGCAGQEVGMSPSLLPGPAAGELSQQLHCRAYLWVLHSHISRVLLWWLAPAQQGMCKQGAAMPAVQAVMAQELPVTVCRSQLQCPSVSPDLRHPVLLCCTFPSAGHCPLHSCSVSLWNTADVPLSFQPHFLSETKRRHVTALSLQSAPFKASTRQIRQGAALVWPIKQALPCLSSNLLKLEIAFLNNFVGQCTCYFHEIMV